jgi:hypothetical protein
MMNRAENKTFNTSYHLSVTLNYTTGTSPQG